MDGDGNDNSSGGDDGNGDGGDVNGGNGGSDRGETGDVGIRSAPKAGKLTRKLGATRLRATAARPGLSSIAKAG